MPLDVIQGSTPPSSPNPGDQWLNTANSRYYTWLIGPSGEGAWVVPSPGERWLNPANGRYYTWLIGLNGKGAWVTSSVLGVAGRAPTPPGGPAPTPLIAPEITNPTPKITSGDVPPSNPANNDLWFDTRSGFLFIWYYDGDTYQWVVTNPGRGSDVPPPASVVATTIESDPGIILTPDPLLGIGSIGVDEPWLDAKIDAAITGEVGSFTQGSVIFAGAGSVPAQDNANFFWNDTNNRLGIGTAAPAVALDVRGAATLTGALTGTTAAFSGLVTALTPTPATDNSTKVATTAFVKAAVDASAATDAGLYEVKSAKGAVSGYAPLDATQKVPAAYLPAYVDDVLEFANLAGFPVTGSSGIIYVALDTGKIYRWSGSIYVEISPSPGSTDAVPEGATNKYYTDERVDDRVAVLVVGGTNITTAYNDAANTLTINAAAYPTGLPPTGTAGGDLSGTYPNPTVIKASGAFAVTGALTGTTATFSGIVTAPWINGVAATDLTINVATGQVITHAVNSVPVVKTQSNAFYPNVTNAIQLGAASNRWSSLSTVLGDFSGALTGTTATFSGNVVAQSQLNIVGAAGTYRIVRHQTDLSGTPTTRWQVGANDDAETGSSAGSNYVLNGLLDSGGGTITALKITRSTGMVTIDPYRAIPAGGASGNGITFSSTVNFGLMHGSGAPTASMARGSLYLRSDGGGPYVNTDGATAWSAVGSGGGASISVGATPPGSPTDGAMWFNSDASNGGGTLYIRYNDGNTTQWVPASPAASATTIPPGSIMDFAGAAAPSGWLLCQGQSLSTTTYAALFAAIAYTYGGSGATFNVPDLRGRVTAGPDAGAGRLTTNTMGSVALAGTGGSEATTLTAAQMPVHNHTATDAGHAHSGAGGGAIIHLSTGTLWTYFSAVGSGAPLYYYSTTDYNYASISVGNAGSGGGHTNMQPTLIMNKIIKT